MLKDILDDATKFKTIDSEGKKLNPDGTVTYLLDLEMKDGTT